MYKRQPAAKPLVSIDEIVRAPIPPIAFGTLSPNGLPLAVSIAILAPPASIDPVAIFDAVDPFQFPGLRKFLNPPLNGFFIPFRNAIDALVMRFPSIRIGPIKIPLRPNLPILRAITPKVTRRPLNANLNPNNTAAIVPNVPITLRANLFNAALLPSAKNP